MSQTVKQPEEAKAVWKHPKVTELVKNKLKSYKAMQRKIHNQNQRLKTLKASMGSASTSKITGMPGGSGNGDSIEERQIIKKDELEYRIKKLKREEQELLEELEALIEQLQNPDEQAVIEMHYIDGMKWWPISRALFDTEPDYEENAEKYLKRCHKIHSSALQALAKILFP